MNNIKKCWYCKRNNASEQSENKETYKGGYYDIKGPFKYAKNIENEWNIARCTDCEIIHKKGSLAVEILMAVVFIYSYISICIFFKEGWVRFVISIILSIIPTYVIGYLITFLIGHYNAFKYKTQTKWARGGNVL